VDPALQTEELNGQHPQSPWQGQVDDVQSCIAPTKAQIRIIPSTADRYPHPPYQIHDQFHVQLLSIPLW
jgi:hypothetical protein